MTVPIRLRRTTWLLMLVLAGGCAAGQPRPVADARTAPSRPAFSYQELIIGQSVEGRSLACHILGEGPDVTLILATIHGNEPAGTPLVEALHVHLWDSPRLLDQRTVILLPVANPDGISAGSRLNARGVDLNRNFPAGNFRPRKRNGSDPLSEPESQAVHELIGTRRPDRIVSIHQPLGCIDYDGPARELAESMAAECDLPLRKIGALPGSLGSYAGETLGIPMITVELPGSASRLSQEELWRRYGPMLLAAIQPPAPIPPEVD